MDRTEWLPIGVRHVRRPEYTGRNRCWPCTALNVTIATVVGVVCSRYSRPLGLLAAAVGYALVALRGYVLPGTPRFAPRLVDRLPVAVGHGSPASVDSGSLAGDVEPEALMDALVEAGVLVIEGEDLYLDGEFRAAWESRMAELRDRSGSELATRAAAASYESVEGQFHGDRVLLAGDRDVWLRPAVAIAETAAVETLSEWGLPEDLRAPAAEPLRTFLRVCPACGGAVGETTLRDCCGGPGSIQRFPERPVLACEACDTVVFEFDETPGPGAT